MVMFQASGDGAVEDLFSFGYFKPATDSVNNFESVSIKKEGGVFKFTAYRDLSTGDSMDSDIRLNTEYPLIWAQNSITPELVMHD